MRVNTTALEYAACISEDERELFFTRLDGDRPAVFRAARENVGKPFGAPERVEAVAGFVEAPTLSADERSLYYHKRDGERFVLYRVTR